MSFTSSYNTVDIAADSPKIRAALTQVLESKGWKLIDNELLKQQGKDQVGVRAHGAEAGRIYPLVFQNPGKEYSSYDIGCRKNEEGNTELIFDRYLGSVNEIFGDDARALSKEVIIQAAKNEHTSAISNMPMSEFMEKYVTNTNGEPMSLEDLKSQEDLILNTLEDPLSALV